MSVTRTAANASRACPDTTPPDFCESDGGIIFGVTLLDPDDGTPLVTPTYEWVHVRTVDGTAIAGSDYEGIKNQRMDYPPGSVRASVVIRLLDDLVPEPTETFNIELFNSTKGINITIPVVTFTIFDDDALPEITFGPSSDTNVSECGPDASFSVVLDASSGGAVTVDYATSDGTASEDEDYRKSMGTLTFAPGYTRKTVSLPILVDNVPEPTETFFMSLSNPSGAMLGDRRRLLVTIVDAACGIGVSIADVGASEDSGEMSFAVTLDAQSGQPVPLNYATADETATAGVDYIPPSDPLIFEPFETEKIISVTILDDDLPELNETFAVMLSDPSNTGLVDLVRARATGTIIDDEGVSLSIADSKVAEDSGQMEFTVTLNAAVSAALAVNFSTSDATARAGSDYAATSDVLMFGVGDTEATARVEVLADAVIEEDETFTVTLSAPSVAGISLFRESATGTILNDDFSILSVADTSAMEGSGRVEFTVTLSEESVDAIQFRYHTSDGTAEAGPDYEMSEDLVTIQPGATEVSIVVPVFEDVLDEDAETFTITLQDPVGASLANKVATATIIDNDDPPGLSIQDATARESAGEMAFVVVLDVASGKSITVEYATSEGTAEAGSDYRQVVHTLEIERDFVTKTVYIPILEDLVDEDDETFTVTLTNPANATITDGQATGTIIDDTDPPGITIADAMASESDGSITFAAVLSTVSAREITVAFSTSDGTAVAGMDYTELAGVLSFAPGDTTEHIEIAVLEDLVDEDEEAFTVLLGNPVNVTLTDESATGRIADNDDRGIALSSTALEIEEGSTATYTVVLTTLPTANVSVDIGGISGDVSVDKPRLSFTPDNWGDEQTVTVSAAEDDDAVTDDVVTLTHAAAGGDYAGHVGSAVVVTILENDAAGVVIDPTELVVVEGSSADYTVVLTSAPTGSVTVSMTADLSTTDLRADPSVLTFSAADWDQAKAVTVTALDDADVMEDEPISLPHVVAGADYEGVTAAAVVVTIEEDETTWDVIGADWLARFGRTVASQTMATIGARLTRFNEFPTRVSVGGMIPALEGVGPAYSLYVPGSEHERPGRLLQQTSFDFSSMRRSSDGVKRTTAWGRVADMPFAGVGSGFDMDANVLTAIVGADFERNRLLVGLGASTALADGGYTFGTGAEGEGSISTFLTSMYPYMRYRFTDRFMAWGLLGYGIGSLTLKEGARGTETDASVTMRMAGFGAHGSLVPGGNTRRLDVAVKSDAFVVRTVSAEEETVARKYGDALRIRLALESSYRIRLGASSSLTPSLEVAARQDAGHAEKGAGMELVGALRFSAGNLAFEASGRNLMLHQDKEYKEWGVGGTFRYSRFTSGRGPFFVVRPNWGRASTGAGPLWMSGSLSRLERSRTSRQHRVTSEAGYGLNWPGRAAIVRPYAAVDIAGMQFRAVRAGGRLLLGSNLRVHLEGGRRTENYGPAQLNVTLRGVLDL